MKQVLSEFPPDQQVVLKPAVDHWRFPYWDWAFTVQGSPILVPELMRTPKTNVERPNGQTVTIDNPMYRFAFPLNSEGKIDGINDVIEDGGQIVPVSSFVPRRVMLSEMCNRIRSSLKLPTRSGIL